MKKTTLLLLFIWVLLNQTAANAYSQGITLSFKSAPLSTIFKEIEKQTNYDFIYPADELYARKVSISVINAKVEEVMDLCLQGLPFTYSVNEKRIVVKKVEEKSPAVAATEKNDPIELTGKVTDEKGKPVAGATVTVRGTNISTATDTNGTFVIKGVDAKATIMVTNVGFEPQIVSLRGKTDLSIKLVVTAQQMKEVVISTGYQKVSPEKFVGSYSQLDSVAYHRRSGMGIIERLDGMVNGVFFTKKGPDPLNFQIRGISSLGGGDMNSYSLKPLIVVDNFPMDARFNLNNINPNDVENITVLKDAAATSIWGVRAGNGVVVITTKKGKYNKSLQVSISSNITVENKPNINYIPRIATSDFIDIEMNLFEQGFYDANLEDTYSWPLVSPVVEILNRRRNNEINEKTAVEEINALRKYDIREDLLEHVYKPSVRQQHYLNLNGGTNQFNYNFSFGFNTISPNIKGSKGSQQYTFNSTTSFRPIKALELQASINYGQGKSKIVPFDYVSIYPYTRLVDDMGTPIAVPYQIRTAYLDTLSAPGLQDWRYRPLDEIKLNNSTDDDRFLNVNLALNYKISTWLSASINYQFASQNNSGKTIKSVNSFSTRDLINRFHNPDPLIDPSMNYPVPIGDILFLSSSESSSSNGRASLNFGHTVGRHQITGMIGSEISQTKGYTSNNQYYGYNERTGTFTNNMNFNIYYPQTFATYPGASGLIQNDQYYFMQPLNRFVSFFGNGSYTLDNKYTIYGSARRDGANVFGVNSNNKWKPLWSVGAKWQLSSESFFNIDWINNLFLRTSYGYSGNVNNSSSGKLTMIYSPSAYYLTNSYYAIPASATNPNLRWEKVKQLNLGIDFSVWKGRLSGSMDYYRKISVDLIANYPLDPTIGVNTYPVNAASLNGNGFEILLRSINTVGEFNWQTTLGATYSKTIVTKVYDGGFKASDFILYGLNISEGREAFAIASYKWGGLDSLTGDPMGYLNGKISKDYQRIFNDSVQNQIFHGSSIPRYTLNVGNTFSFKSFSFSFTLNGRFQYYFRKPSLEINHRGEFRGTNYTSEYYARWQKPGDEKATNIPSIIYPVPSEVSNRSSFYSGSEINVLRGDNIKLQDIRIQYEFRQRRKKTFNSIQVFFYPNNLNLIVWRANNSSLDPDFSGGSSATAIPPPKTWTFGANVNF